MKRTIFERFEKRCWKSFKFLEEEFGFRVVKRARDSISSSLIFQNETTAVEISLEPIDGGVFVLLSRLVNGKIPKYPIFIKRETRLDSFYLDDLLQLRLPGTTVKHGYVDKNSQDRIEQTLAQAADQLREHGSEVLRGDFKVFSKLDAIVKARLPAREES